MRLEPGPHHHTASDGTEWMVDRELTPTMVDFITDLLRLNRLAPDDVTAIDFTGEEVVIETIAPERRMRRRR